MGFNFTAALIAGLSAWLVASAVLAIWEWSRRNADIHLLNPLDLAGGIITDQPPLKHIIGALLLLITGQGYAIFISAFIYAWESYDYAWLIGIATGLALSVVSGVTLAYARLWHRGVRDGSRRHPRAFALGLSREAAIQLFVAHLIFGAVAGTVYTALE